MVVSANAARLYTHEKLQEKVSILVRCVMR